MVNECSRSRNLIIVLTNEAFQAEGPA